MTSELIDKLRDTDSYYRIQEKHWCIDGEELERQRLAAADLIETQAAELAKFKALAETLAGALEQMHRAVCHETGFAEAVRADSGLAYPWEPLDVAADASLKALRKYKEARDDNKMA